MTDLPEITEQIVASRDRRARGQERPERDPDLARIRRGYYRPATADLTVDDQHRLRIISTAMARRPEIVFSHASAAILWGAPLLAADLADVHAIQPGRPRRTTAGVRVHSTSLPDEHVVMLPSGLLVTSREWTAVQVAATLDLPNVLLPLDYLLRLIVEDARCAQATVVDALLDMMPPRMRGRGRAERNLRIADARSGSAGESLSRGQMVLLDVPMPELQVRFRRADGSGEDVVDFDWEELGTFGEFDGTAKYFSPKYQAGRTPQEVLWDEKQREDRVRRHRPRGVRWGWSVALSRQRLAAVLASAGIKSRRRRGR